MEEQNDEIREISMHRDQNNSEQTDNLATCEFPINTMGRGEYRFTII